MRAICLGAKVPYVPNCDRALPPAERTTFHLKPLSARERALLLVVDPQETAAAFHRRVLAVGLLGWENYRAPDGAPVAFQRNPDAAAHVQPYLEVLDDPLVEELVAAVFDAARVSRADEGKSNSPSAAPSAGSASSATPA